MTTVRDLIKSSLRLITVIGAGENMTADDAVDGLATLNQMLESWYADGAVIYSSSQDSKALTAGNPTYTMGPSGDINTTRPTRITSAIISDGSINYPPLNLWTYDVYSTISVPSTQTLPTDMYINQGNPLLTLSFYPVPAGAYTLTIYSEKPLANVGLNDVLVLPPGYERAIRYGLAVELAPEYEREASGSVQNTAKVSLATIKRNNRYYNQAMMAVDPALEQQYFNGGYTDFNIYRGY